MHTCASRESPSILLTKRRVLLEWEKEKNLILFHPLFPLHTTIIWYCLSSVYVPFFLLSRVWWTTTNTCKLEAMFNHVLKLENVNIYILERTAPQLQILYRLKLTTFSYLRLLLFKKRRKERYLLTSLEFDERKERRTDKTCCHETICMKNEKSI